jgi:hypothetical protein
MFATKPSLLCGYELKGLHPVLKYWQEMKATFFKTGNNPSSLYTPVLQSAQD